MANKPDRYLRFWLGDYLGGTMHLDTIQHGAYLLLLFHYWAKREPPPDDDRELAAITKLSTFRFSRLRETLVKFFDVQVRNGSLVWVHHRMEQELASAQEAYTKMSAGGETGAERRWGAHRKKNGPPNALPNGGKHGNHTSNTENNTSTHESLAARGPAAGSPDGPPLPPHDAWGGKALALANRIGAMAFDRTFACVTFEPGPPSRLVFPQSFRAGAAAAAYAIHLHETFEGSPPECVGPTTQSSKQAPKVKGTPAGDKPG